MLANSAYAKKTTTTKTPAEKEAAEAQAKIDETADAASSKKHKDGHTTLKNLEFNVNEVLSLGDEDQAYFSDTKNKQPIVSFILRVIEFATNIMGSIAIIILIVAGFMFMFAQGNQQQLDEAKEVVKYAFIGLALAFFSYIITIFIQSFFISSEQDTTAQEKSHIEQIA